MADKTLYIVDAHAHIYASYYAIKALSSPGGEPTNAVYGFTATLLALLRDRQPTGLVVVFDHPGPGFRHEIYPEYKATRQPMPEDLPGQIRRIHDVIDALGVPTLCVEGVEADDVIATLARQASADGYKVFICSKDKDLEPLIGPEVVLFDAKTGREIDAVELAREKGYRPEQATDVLALTGDSSDNVPGVPGVGPKTAAKLLAQYGTLDNLLARRAEIDGKVGERIRENLAAIDLSRRLVILRGDVKLPGKVWREPAARPDRARLTGLFDELGFAKFLEQLDLGAEPAAEASRQAGVTTADQCHYLCADTPEKLDSLAEQLARRTEFAIDTETTSLDSLHCELVGMSFAWEDRRGWYVPVRSPGGGGVGLPLELVVGRLGPILANPKIAKIGHHMKFDYEALAGAGMSMANLAFDTMIAAYLLDPEKGSYGLDTLAQALLGHRTIPITDLIGKGRNQISMRDVPLEQIIPYAAEDADVTWRLCGLLKPRLAEAGLLRLLAELEMPLVVVLAEMETSGVTLDLKLLETMGRQMDRQAGELAERIYQAAGSRFNIDSTQQLAKVLFERLGLQAGKTTRTGRQSTDQEVLEQLAHRHEVPRLVLEYRQLVKLKGTYVDALPRLVHPSTGRVHPDFTQTRTATGRLACQEPNLQNIPVRSEIGRQIRRALVPRSADNVLLTADYSQIELRMLAHFSRDPALMAAFAEDQDIHAFVASEVFGVPIEDVNPEQRRRAKAVNFGIIYGQTPYGLARSLGIGQAEAGDFIDEYFKRYRTIRRFLDHCIEQARQTGYATTIMDRRRPIPDINSRNRTQRALAERMAINTVTQGSAADLIKQAMVNIHHRVHRQNRPVMMLIQVHDELVFELPESRVEQESEMIRREMTGAMRLNVPLKVDVAWGSSWLEAK